jgi:endonuclease III
MSTAGSLLRQSIAALRRFYDQLERPPSGDAFELVLFENVAYLAPSERRRAAFELLQQTLGTKPEAIQRASRAQLERVTAHGILKTRFAVKLRECARIAVQDFGGDLDAVLDISTAQARRALRRFPGIGAPGADRILLFSGRLKTLAPESNGLRVLARLGCIAEDKSYARLYKAGVEAATALPATLRALQDAHLLLRQHGHELCRIAAPRCAECPLQRDCAFAVAARRIFPDRHRRVR